MYDVVNKFSDDEYFGKIGIIYVIFIFVLLNIRVFMIFFFKLGFYYIN